LKNFYIIFRNFTRERSSELVYEWIFVLRAFDCRCGNLIFSVVIRRQIIVWAYLEKRTFYIEKFPIFIVDAILHWRIWQRYCNAVFLLGRWVRFGIKSPQANTNKKKKHNWWLSWSTY